MLAIVVPMLNEREALPDLLDHLDLWCARACEIVLVDGGSTDGSAEIARSRGFTVMPGARGRARQMNTGAAATCRPALLFLHADTRLPDTALSDIAMALGSGASWGRFDVRITGRSPLLKMVAGMMNWRSRLSSIATGDQAIFVTRKCFKAVGGFADQPLMEDIALSASLKQLSAPACLKSRVVTSGRRWEAGGVWRTILLMWSLRLAYWCGVPAERLARSYR